MTLHLPALVLVLLVGCAMPALAHDIASRNGAVLTVAGDIRHGNRGPVEPDADSFFSHHDVRFKRARAFDIAMLEALGMHKIIIVSSRRPATWEVEGPLLKDVLGAAGAAAGRLSLLALDGFRAEIGTAELAARDWIVGIKLDGSYLDLGGRGPAWIVFTPAAPGGRATHEEEARWPWAIFLIQVQAGG